MTMRTNMAKIARCINFICDNCGKLNFHPDSLEKGMHDGKPVMKDRIDCSKCKQENYVYEDIEGDYTIKKMIFEISEESRVIVCAALKHSISGQIICGARHFDSVMNEQIRNNIHKGWSNSIQGFIDQFGQFLTRKEAYDIAKRKNQIIRSVGGDSKELYSENLY